MEGYIMAGLFSNDEHPSFDWGANEEIFDNLGNPTKREEYLQDLSGTGNLERQMAAQVQELDRDEMEQILHQIPEKADREDYIRTYFGMK